LAQALLDQTLASGGKHLRFPRSLWNYIYVNMLSPRILASLVVVAAMRPEADELTTDLSECEKAIFKFINGGHVNGAIELDEWFHAFQRMDEHPDDSLEERDHIISLPEWQHHMKCKSEAEEEAFFTGAAGGDEKLSMEEWATVFTQLDDQKDYAITLKEMEKLNEVLVKAADGAKGGGDTEDAVDK